MKLLKVIAVAFVMLHSPTQATDPHQLMETAVHEFHSEILGDDIAIAVALPFGYANTDENYPIILALDGDVMFGITSEIPRLMAFENSMPKVIVASVLYGNFQNWISKRSRDMHAKNDGARKFLSAIETEVMPFLSQHYRIDEARKTLYGHSSGGAFSLYIATQNPQLFQQVFASSPSLEEEPATAKMILKLARENIHILPKTFISVGDAEAATIEALKPLTELMEEKAAAHTFKFKTYENNTHMAVIAGAYSDGLRWLFRK